jgi:glycosyltransferase involved in cell wall biosynthesis
MPRASVIMSVHDAQSTVATAIRSVLAQTMSDLELLVIDDGSTDGSFEQIERAVDADPRVRIFRQSNIGLSATLADAVPTIRSSCFGTVDADDFLEPTALAKCLELFEARRDVGMIYTGYVQMDRDGRVLGPGPKMRVPYSPQQLLVDFMTFHFRLVRRGAYEKTSGYDPSLPYAQDYDLCLKLSEVTTIAHIPDLLYRYRYHPSSLSIRKRVEQIECARRAIEAAIERRGISGSTELVVEIIGKFVLSRRSK